MLSNTLSAAGRHEEAQEVVRKMKEQGVRKMSWIEIDGRQHTFVGNDATHQIKGETR